MTRGWAVVLMGVIAGVGAADPPKSEPAAVELVLLAGDRPARLRFDLELDGRPHDRAWDAAFDKLLAFADADGNGVLSEAEAGRLPSAYAVRQVLWGQFNPQSGAAPPLAELDADNDKRVTRAELARWYRQAGAEATVGVGTAPNTAALTDALVKALDADGDGRVTEPECKTAPAALRKLDANDDELVTPGELVAKAVYPGAAGTTRLTAGGDSPFPAVLLPGPPTDSRWAAEVLRRSGAKTDGALTAAELGLPAALDADRDGRITARELAGWRSHAADAAWRIRFGGATGPTVTGKGENVTPTGWSRGGVRVDVRGDDGRLAEQLAAARKRFTTQFTDTDTDGDGTVTAEEAAKPRPAPLKALLPAADRDGDGRLATAELNAWLDLQAGFAAAHMLVTVLDHGPGLFELLDADHDGALSLREMRGAWERVAGCVTGGAFDRAKLPRQVVVVVGRGQPAAALGRPPCPGPTWFRAMDRNGDGDVSRREFTGPADVFERFDRDKDGLLSAAEAETAGAKK